MSGTRSRSWLLALWLTSITGCAVGPAPQLVGYQPADADVSITRVVHGGVIVALHRTQILVDPWFYPRWAFHHSEPLPFLPTTLPSLDAIAITTEGAETLDTSALQTLSARVPRIIAPAGVSERLRDLGFADVVAIAPGSDATVHDVTVAATADGGYVLAHDATRVFVATNHLDDTTLAPTLTTYSPLSVALVPIGGPRLLGFQEGLDPEQAMRWAGKIRADRTIPYRYGRAGSEPLWSFADKPTDRFLAAAKGTLPRDRIVILRPGEGWHYTR